MNSTPMSAMPIDDHEAFLKKHEDENAGKRKELTNWVKLVARNPDCLFALTFVGAKINAPPEVIKAGIKHILYGNMKVNGKPGDWSCGCFGSRWFDYTHDGKVIRVAFYSKKYSKEWNKERPYAIAFDTSEFDE